jgi:uncharacterized integral membrane protein
MPGGVGSDDMRVVRRPQSTTSQAPRQPEPSQAVLDHAASSPATEPAEAAGVQPDSQIEVAPEKDTGQHAGWAPLEESAPTGTRASMAWFAVSALFVALVLVVVFVLQNLDRVSVHFLFLHFRLPLGVALLIGILIGAAVVLGVGLARIRELRHYLRRS